MKAWGWFLLVLAFLAIVGLVVAVMYFWNKDKADTIVNWASGLGMLGNGIDSLIGFGTWFHDLFKKKTTSTTSTTS